MIKAIALVLFGATIATGLLISCSDDSPRDVDAAVCDCPAAESPIPGRVMRIRGQDDVLAANGVARGIATCPAGATLITGWCGSVNMAGTPPQLALVQAGAEPSQPGVWQCDWQNYNGGSATVHAEVVCLMPPQ